MDNNRCKKCRELFSKKSFPVSKIELLNDKIIDVCKPCSDIYNDHRIKFSNGQDMPKFNSKYFWDAFYE